jgi:hypothetical protein
LLRMTPAYPLLHHRVTLRTAILDIHFIHYASVDPMTVSIDFTWHKDASGYRLVKKGSLPGNKPTIDTIMPNGGERILIRPMEMADIYRNFAHVYSAEGLLKFVEDYGLLGPYEGKKHKGTRVYRDPNAKWHDYDGMPVGIYLKEAELFREAMRQKAKGPEQLAAFLKTISAPPTNNLGFLQLIPDEVSGARFQIMPITLMQALWCQLSQVLTSNIKLSTCLRCGQLFEAGLRTGRRADAKFCSDEHRTLYHSLNRKPARRS